MSLKENPLTQSELAEFKLMLEELRRDTARALEGTKKEVMSADDSSGAQSQHPGDMGTDVSVKTLNLAVTAAESDLLRSIEGALKKFELGTFGICEDTNEPISIKRLRALPWARRTAQAQEKHDKNKKSSY